MIVETCKAAGLPEPELKERDSRFMVTLFKDSPTELIVKLGLNERQMKAVLFVKAKGRITNSEYQNLFSVNDSFLLEPSQK